MEFRGPTERLEKIAAALEKAGHMDEEITERCGAAGVAMMLHRTTVLHLDADGNSFEDYSTKPAYIYDQPGSTSATKGARAVRKDDRAHLVRGKKGRAAVRMDRNNPAGRSVSTSSHFFPGGYEQFKSSIGHDGVDLMVSGRMLGAMGQPESIGVTEVGKNRCTINFLDQTQLDIARGNNEKREFWGIARTPDERLRLGRIAARSVAQKIRKAIYGTGATPDEVARAVMAETGIEMK